MNYCGTCGESYPADDVHLCLLPEDGDGDPIKGIGWGLALSLPIWIGIAVWLILR